ncbi:Electrogenic sodium bicarbonate cotransporter 1 [Pteropus alecto]|uniref:Electrogenic sodium bicarbonate cotransporter 1 n=1 Tax=Pteropus alecto TaxID=9402 RepID=L5KB79_PTEAL|nr:Electrogenic sodium bicarbonate cotransporter 1 [Pteropus alecto]
MGRKAVLAHVDFVLTGLTLIPVMLVRSFQIYSELCLMLAMMEDEAVLDRGASFLKHVCDEEEVEGHHTIYIGVHVPKSYRRRRRHKRKTGHKEKKEKERISENYSDKSDVENADESSSSILKPLISQLELSMCLRSWSGIMLGGGTQMDHQIKDKHFEENLEMDH